MSAALGSARARNTNEEVILEVERHVDETGETVGGHSLGGEYPEDLVELLSTGQVDARGLWYNAEAYGTFQDGERVYGERIIANVPGQIPEGAVRPGGENPAIPARAQPVLTSSVVELLSEKSPVEYIDVSILLREEFELAPLPISLPGEARGAEERAALRAERVAARKSFTTRSQASLQSELELLGAVDFESFWISNILDVAIPAGEVAALAEDPRIRRIALARVSGGPMRADRWDGADMRAADGLNAGAYLDLGYAGQRTTNSSVLKVAVLDSWFLLPAHTGFYDYNNTGSRAEVWNCIHSPCQQAFVQDDLSDGASLFGSHGTVVSGIVVGDATDNQWAGMTTIWKKEHSGVAGEAEVVFLQQKSSSSAVRAIQKSVELGVDLISVSYQWGYSNCDGTAPNNLDVVVADVVMEDGIPFFMAAGNPKFQDVCGLNRLADSPVVFTVGGVGTSQHVIDPPNVCVDDYSTCNIGRYWGYVGSGFRYSARGGYDVETGGVVRSGAGTGVDLVAPACVYNQYNVLNGFSGQSCGTSFAQPQVAGIGLLYKTWWLNVVGNTWIDSAPGRLYAALLSMGDRTCLSSTTGCVNSKRTTTGFDPLWGAGRVQARMQTPSNSTGFANTWFNLSNGGEVTYLVNGSGAEPQSIAQFKATAIWFEEDHDDVADVTMQLYADDCGPGAQLLAYDTSYDLKKMVRAGSSAAGESLCVKLRAWHVPSGEIRRVYLHTYYSSDASMR